MDFIDFVSLWRKSTHHFASESLWNIRLNQLGIYSIVDLEKYWKNLQDSNKKIRNFPFDESETDFKRKDGVHSFIEYKIAIELCKFTEESIQIAGIPLILCEQAKDNLITALLSELKHLSIRCLLLLFQKRILVMLILPIQLQVDPSGWII